LQAESQQKPSVQNPLAQSVSWLHTDFGGNFVTHSPAEQYWPVGQVPDVAHAPLHLVVPKQSSGAQI